MQAIKAFSLSISALSLSLIVGGLVTRQPPLIYGAAAAQLVDVGLKTNRRRYLEVAPEELDKTQRLLDSVRAERDAALQIDPTTQFLIDTNRQTTNVLIQQQESLIEQLTESNTVAYAGIEQLTYSLKEAAQHIVQLQSYYYNLVQGRADSRRLFLQSLQKVECRLIMVCPWIPEWLDDYVIKELQHVLSRGASIEIGWGHLGDVGGKLNQLSWNALLSGHKSEWYSGLYKLQRLSGDITFKLIGTHEKYYVVDDQFCVVGSHNFLTSNGRSPEREVTIHTNNPQLVEQLIVNFEQSPIY